MRCSGHGPTGSGKSSCAVDSRLYDTTAGTVRVGGHDVREYRFADLRQNVSMVLQKNTLFSGTIFVRTSYGETADTRRDDSAGQTCTSA